MRFRHAAVPIVIASVLAACTGDGPRPVAAARPGCEQATARAVASGSADARQSALASLKYDIQDVRGFMLKNGYRVVRADAPKVVCGPYPLAVGLGLKTCVATADLCGR